MEEPSTQMIKNYIVATIGNENLAFPVSSVFGVYPIPDVTCIPNAPDHVSGIAVIWNQALPVVDIDKPEAKYLLVILENGKDRFALGVQKVKSINEILLEEVKNVDLNQNNISPFANYSIGVWKNGGEKVWVIDPEKLIWTKEDNNGA
jgi:chemotaxis signal transduction protein